MYRTSVADPVHIDRSGSDYRQKKIWKPDQNPTLDKPKNKKNITILKTKQSKIYSNLLEVNEYLGENIDGYISIYHYAGDVFYQLFYLMKMSPFTRRVLLHWYENNTVADWIFYDSGVAPTVHSSKRLQAVFFTGFQP